MQLIHDTYKFSRYAYIPLENSILSVGTTIETMILILL